VRPVGGPGSPGVLLVEGEKFNLRRFYAPPSPTLRFQPGDIVGFDDNGMPSLSRPVFAMGRTPIAGTKKFAVETDATIQYNLSDVVMESQKGAMVAQAQLQNDIAQVDALNTARKAFNDHVMSVAKDASGKDLGKEPKDWREGVTAKGQYARKPSKQPRKPTIDELVPLAYMPRFGELSFIRQVKVVDS
jgi:hypothetical protein